ncbi:MAG: hypothetical protein ABIL06_13070 [Pseudomonadota bacterium]
MKINTKKIKYEMDRLGITQAQLGAMIKPPMTRQGASYAIKHGKTFAVIDQIAKVLQINPRDLIL